MRVFVAIDLPEIVCSELEELQAALAVGRPVPSQNLHLTLSFLGEQTDEHCEEAHHALSTIRAASFDLRLRGVGSFGTRTPKVIYADVERSQALVELERQVNRTLRSAGLDFQKRRFRPHVTIARVPRHLSAREFSDLRDFLAYHSAFRGSYFKVTRFHFYCSFLTHEAARHDLLSEYRLQEADTRGLES